MNAVFEALHRLRKSGIQYVVFGDSRRGARFSSENHPVINLMCEEPAAVANFINAEPVSRDTVQKDGQYTLSDAEGGVFSLNIYQKGFGVFPERFETEMMSSKVVIDDCYYGLDIDREFWAALYVEAFHKGNFEPDLRSIVVKKLLERFGPPSKPKYVTIGHYPDFSVVHYY